MDNTNTNNLTKIKIGLIGCGYWGKNLIRELYTLDNLDTICDTDIDLLNYHKGLFPNLKITTNYDDMLMDKNITAICISLPVSLHYKFAKLALENDKDVYIEKPFTLVLNDAKELIEFAKDKKKILMVGHLLQYHPCIDKIKEMISENKIGKIMYILSNRLNLGKIRNEENVLWSFATHDISVILSLLNDNMPNSITCHGKSYICKNIHDITTTILEYDNDVYAQINVNWLHPHKEQKLVIVGSDGMISFEDTKNDEKILYYPNYLKQSNNTMVEDKKEPVIIEYSKGQPLIIELQHFINCCKNRLTPLTDGEEGLRVLKILDYANKSLINGGLKISNIHLLSEKKIDYYAHPSSFIDDGAQIGKGCKIWHNTHVCSGALIGENTSLGQNNFIASGAVLGKNNRVQNNVSVYSGIYCEDDVFLGPSCVLTNDMNPRVQYSKNGNYLKTYIKKGTSIGAGAIIRPGITLGEYSFIGCGAVVVKDVEPYSIMVGNPAKCIGTIDEMGNRKLFSKSVDL